MKACSKCREIKALSEYRERRPDKRGRVTRDHKVSNCKACDKLIRRAHYVANRADILAKAKDHAATNSARKSEYNKRYRAANGAKISGLMVRWRAANEAHLKAYEKTRDPAYFARRYVEKKSEILEKQRQYEASDPARKKARTRKYYENNRAHAAASCRKRQADKLRATPAWADATLMIKFYEEAQAKTLATGIVHHVDHIIPLRGRTVCGLHVHYNLEVVTAKANLSKGNKLDME